MLFKGCVLLALLLTASLVQAQSPPACPAAPDGVTTYRDYTDTVYGGHVRQVKRPTGTDRNLYHFRDPWNADTTYMLGVREREINNHSANAADLVLYDGNGCFLKVLFNIGTDYSWEAVWDKHDPKTLYTRKGARLYRYNVTNGGADLLVDLATMGGDYITVSPSINQDGTRIGLGGKNYTWHSWELPFMTNYRKFTPSHQTWMEKAPIYQNPPKPCDLRNWRYVGWKDVVVTDCRQDLNNLYGAGFYQDDGTFVLYHVREIGHTDVGPAGKWAYFVEEQNHSVSIHLVDLPTGSDTVIATFLAGGYDGMHLSWPRKVADWFLLGFFSPSSPTSTSTKVPYDELYKITTSGTVTPLTRTFTTQYPEATIVDGINGYFWTQPEPEVSADGSRINFNGNCDPKPPGVDEPVPPGNCTRAFEGDAFLLFLNAQTPSPSPLEPATNLTVGVIAGSSTSALSTKDAPVQQIALPPACPTSPDGITTYNDYVDSTYGGAVRQIVHPTTANRALDRNLYHFRNPWNINNTYMLGVREQGVGINNTASASTFVTLYSGNGCFLRTLYPITDHQWELVWDKTDPDIFYTRTGSSLQRYHVSTDAVDLLVNLNTPAQGNLSIGVSPSLNQDGTRIGVGISNNQFRSWDLPNMTNQLTFTPSDGTWVANGSHCLPPDDRRNWRYVGWGNVVVIDCRNEAGNLYGSGFYQHDGTFLFYHEREFGHTDAGPGGYWAYFVEESNHSYSIHLVNLTTAADTVIATLPTGGNDGGHISWPRARSDFFIMGFFPPGGNAGSNPGGTQSYNIPYDELYKFTLATPPTNPATVTVLTRTFTTEWDDTVINDEGVKGYFWTQPEPEISADGSRITWNMNCDQKPVNDPQPIPSGNCIRAFEGDQAILFLEAATEPPPTGGAIAGKGLFDAPGKQLNPGTVK